MRKFNELKELEKLDWIDHRDMKKNVQFVQVRFEEI
jgi:hypothetical protein